MAKASTIVAKNADSITAKEEDLVIDDELVEEEILQEKDCFVFHSERKNSSGEQ